MAALAALAASALLVTGCVPTREIPPARPSESDLELYIQRDIDDQWEFLGLRDELRPEIEVEIVSVEDWPRAVADCMNELGYDGYRAESGGFTSTGGLRDERESIAWYSCFAGHQFDRGESGMISSASLDYLYDYYVTTLVPCLQSHGISLHFVPTRSEAGTLTGDYAGWNPYYEISETFNPTTREWDRFVYDECPPFPKGEAFDPYREIWGPP